MKKWSSTGCFSIELTVARWEVNVDRVVFFSMEMSLREWSQALREVAKSSSFSFPAKQTLPTLSLAEDTPPLYLYA